MGNLLIQQLYAILNTMTNQQESAQYLPVNKSVITYYPDVIPYVKKVNKENQKIIVEENHFYLAEEDYINLTMRMLKSPNELTEIDHLTMGLESCLILLKKDGLNEEVFSLYSELTKDLLTLEINDKFRKEFRTILCSDQVRYILMRLVLSKLIAKELKISSDFYLKKIYLSCLFCDIGEMIPNPKKEYHAKWSAEQLKDKNISEDILQAIYHHHEYEDGSGHLGLTKHQIHPIAKIIRVSEEWLNLMKSKKRDYPVEFSLMAPLKLNEDLVKACLALFNKKSN